MAVVYRQPLTQTEEEFKPLTIGAAYVSEFLCRTPRAWSGAIVFAKAFKILPLHNAGWDEDRTDVEDCGAYGPWRRWRFTRNDQA